MFNSVRSKAFANAQLLLRDILLDRGLCVTLSTQSHRRRETQLILFVGVEKVRICFYQSDYSRCRQVKEYFLEYDVKKHLKYRRFQMCTVRPLKSDSRQKIMKRQPLLFGVAFIQFQPLGLFAVLNSLRRGNYGYRDQFRYLFRR